MSLISTLQQWCGFTRNEILVVFLLAAAFLAGVTIRWASSEGEAAEYEYAAGDSVFLERSQKLREQLPEVPEKKKPAPKQPAARQALQPGSIPINTATKEQLMLLPGIGERYAERIILYREDHGPFRSVDELVNIKGIGKKTLEKIRPYVTVQ